MNEDLLLLAKAVSNLAWELDYYQFCRYVLDKDSTREQLDKDAYCWIKWQQFQDLDKALKGFDSNTLEKMIEVYCQSRNIPA